MLQIRSLLLLGALAAVSACQPAPSSTTAVMFRGGPDHRGVASRMTVDQVSGLRWIFPTNGPVRSSPVVSDSVLYVGSNDGYLYALNAADGGLRWRFDAGAAVNSTPAVSGDAVYLADDAGVIHALARADGRERWRLAGGPTAPLAWGVESGDRYTSSPALVGAVVVVGNRDGRVYAIRRRHRSRPLDLHGRRTDLVLTGGGRRHRVRRQSTGHFLCARPGRWR